LTFALVLGLQTHLNTNEGRLYLGNGPISWEAVLVRFGCAFAASPISCLRQVPATDIKTYIEAYSLAFPPVNGDGTSINDIRPSISSRKFADVPVMMGTNLNEARVFLAILGLNNGTAAVDTVLSTLGITDPAVQQSIFAAYAAEGVEASYYVADR
jgi:carboxylesterase type B